MGDVLQLRRDIGIQADRGSGRSIQNGFEENAAGFAAKRQRAGAHLVEYRAEREKVSARVQVFAPHLLGRHVSDGAERSSRAGELFFVKRNHGSALAGRAW